MKLLKHVLVIFVFLLHSQAKASLYKKNNQIKYKTYFGSCPSQVAGKLTLTLMREFEKKSSLLDVKKLIVRDRLDEKHFISHYDVSYNPTDKLLKFNFECPKPLLKAQIYKENGEQHYTAVLVEGGRFVDPTYEVLLRGEEKLKSNLPNLAFPISLVESKVQVQMADLTMKFHESFQDSLSEIILDEERNLTFIFSLDRRPSTAFLGKDFWHEKVEKLSKVLKYMQSNQTIPAVINLTNSKKVVVKFSDTL